eukprot:sb/3473439/
MNPIHTLPAGMTPPPLPSTPIPATLPAGLEGHVILDGSEDEPPTTTRAFLSTFLRSGTFHGMEVDGLELDVDGEDILSTSEEFDDPDQEEEEQFDNPHDVEEEQFDDPDDIDDIEEEEFDDPDAEEQEGPDHIDTEGRDRQRYICYSTQLH